MFVANLVCKLGLHGKKVDTFEEYYGRPQKKGYHLHHINMCKADDCIENLDELKPRDHQLMHATFNLLCKPLMDKGIVKYTSGKGYYLNKQGDK